jgi:AraC family transcriptional regulator, regulatory protein of adaptative response / methylated-DNA-[protein]-cysteine methyltransferase
MKETSTTTSQPSPSRDIIYSYGQCSLGGFLTAIDGEGVCAILLGEDRVALLRDLQVAFPSSKLELDGHSGPCHSVADAVVSLVKQPAEPFAHPTSIRGSDFEQMLDAALRRTEPGTTITPAEIAVLIGGGAASAQHVRTYASNDHLAVAVPFHRLQERDGTSPAYRWGEERRLALLKREAAIRAA